MRIISVNLPDSYLKEMDSLIQIENRENSRGEIIRDAIRTFLIENYNFISSAGEIDGLSATDCYQNPFWFRICDLINKIDRKICLDATEIQLLTRIRSGWFRHLLEMRLSPTNRVLQELNQTLSIRNSPGFSILL
jgi:hypothetical protein